LVTFRKSIVIVGASSGIGAALAHALADDGHELYICARRTDRLAKVAEGYDNIFHAPCDIGQEAPVENFFQEVQRRAGFIDVLIQCAAVLGPVGRFNEIDSNRWFDAVRTNLFGAFLVAKHVVPAMKPERRPRIIMLSGGGAFDPMPRVSAYGVSKAAIVRLVETLAVELEPRNIAVNAMAPGFVATEIHEATLAAGRAQGGQHYDRTLKLMSRRDDDMKVPIGCVRYMISDAAAAITGRTISARYDPWGEPEFDQRIDDIMASPLYTTQRTTPAHLKGSALGEVLTRAANATQRCKKHKVRAACDTIEAKRR
jgi:NAD(P)-dependent dehydrogenase (short-subunit alcohol dehydrogenase family)